MRAQIAFHSYPRHVLVILLLCLAALFFFDRPAYGYSRFRFDFREAIVSDSTYQRVLGKLGNEVYDISYGRMFLNEWIGGTLGAGILMESDSKGGSSLSVFLARMYTTFIVQVPIWGIQPFVEGGFMGTYFRTNLSSVGKRDDWRYGPLVRGGVNFSLKKLIAPTSGFPVAEDLDLKDIVLSAHVGYEKMNLFDGGMDFSMIYASVGFQLVY